MNYEDDYGEYLHNCDTTNITYNNTIKFVVADNCLECHSPSGGQLPDYTNYQTLVNYGDTILNRINSATNPMPPTGQMNKCNIAKMNHWYDIGSPEN